MATVALPPMPLPGGAPVVSDIAKALSSNLLRRNFLEGRPFREDPSKEVVRTPHSGNPNLPPAPANGVDAKKAALSALNSILLNKDWKAGRPDQPVLIQWPKVKRDATGALHPETSPCSSSASSPRTRSKGRRNNRRNRKATNSQGTGTDEGSDGYATDKHSRPVQPEVVRSHSERIRAAHARQFEDRRPKRCSSFNNQHQAGRDNDLCGSPRDQNAHLQKEAEASAHGYLSSSSNDSAVPVPRTPDRVVSWPGAVGNFRQDFADPTLMSHASFAFEEHQEMLQCNPLYLEEEHEVQEQYYALPIRVCEVACQTEDIYFNSGFNPLTDCMGFNPLSECIGLPHDE